MQRNFQQLQLANVRACDVRRVLESILVVATAERENPTRPPVGCMILIQPSPHVLPYFVRRRTDLVLAIYECPEQRIDANTAPLLWANMTPSDACHDGCSGQCSGDLPLEIWIGERFPLLPVDVYMLFVDELGLDPHTCGEPPSVWIAICDRASEPLACTENAGDAENAEDAEDTAADPGANSAADEPQSFLDTLTCFDWLLGKMRTLADLFDTDPFYDGFMDHYKEEHGYYPKDSARTYARITDRCRRRILGERPPTP